MTLSKTLAALRAEALEEADRDKRRAILREISLTEAKLDFARRAWLR